MNLNNFFQSKIFQGIILGLLIVTVFLLVFKAGVFVGIKKADFSCRWSDNYHRNFAGPQQGFMQGFDDRNFMEANGTFGQIIKIDGQTLVVKGQNDMEKIILINDQTIINSFRDSIKPSDLKIDDQIVIIGEANNSGQIEAKLIRLMPPTPMMPFNN